eukprot:673246-Hanusia_phi.AAC.1
MMIVMLLLLLVEMEKMMIEMFVFIMKVMKRLEMKALTVFLSSGFSSPAPRSPPCLQDRLGHGTFVAGVSRREDDQPSDDDELRWLRGQTKIAMASQR